MPSIFELMSQSITDAEDLDDGVPPSPMSKKLKVVFDEVALQTGKAFAARVLEQFLVKATMVKSSLTGQSAEQLNIPDLIKDLKPDLESIYMRAAVSKEHSDVMLGATDEIIAIEADSIWNSMLPQFSAEFRQKIESAAMSAPSPEKTHPAEIVPVSPSPLGSNVTLQLGGVPVMPVVAGNDAAVQNTGNKPLETPKSPGCSIS